MTPPSENLLDVLDQVAEGVIVGIKVETEGEGAPWSRVHALVGFARQHGLAMTLKIGGPDARTDLIQAAELGLDGVTAPLVESAFAVEKFRSAVSACFGHPMPLERNVLIESAQGLQNYKAIYSTALEFATGINFGRSDLRMSLAMVNPNLPSVDDSGFLDFLTTPAKEARARGFTVTLGGNVQPRTVSELKSHELGAILHRIETRRFVLAWDEVKRDETILEAVLGIEEVLSSHELKFLTATYARESKRLGELRSRLTRAD